MKARITFGELFPYYKFVGIDDSSTGKGIVDIPEEFYKRACLVMADFIKLQEELDELHNSTLLPPNISTYTYEVTFLPKKGE